MSKGGWRGETGVETRVEGDRGGQPTTRRACDRTRGGARVQNTYRYPVRTRGPRFVTARILPRAERESRLVRICMQIASRIPVARQTARHGNQFCGLAAVIECGVNK